MKSQNAQEGPTSARIPAPNKRHPPKEWKYCWNWIIGVWVSITPVSLYLSMFDIVYSKIYKNKKKNVKERLMKVICKVLGRSSRETREWQQWEMLSAAGLKAQGKGTNSWHPGSPGAVGKGPPIRNCGLPWRNAATWYHGSGHTVGSLVQTEKKQEKNVLKSYIIKL